MSLSLVWATIFILFVIIILRREHQDRKSPILVGELIPGDKFGVPLRMSLNKSWWEKIWEFVRLIGLSITFMGIGWLLHGLTGLIYG